MGGQNLLIPVKPELELQQPTQLSKGQHEDSERKVLTNRNNKNSNNNNNHNLVSPGGHHL